MQVSATQVRGGSGTTGQTQLCQDFFKGAVALLDKQLLIDVLFIPSLLPALSPS